MTRQSFVSALVLAAAALSAHAQAPKNLTVLPPNAFEHVYRHVKYLQDVDSAAAASGRPSNLRLYYKNLAGLTQPEADAMQEVSRAALAELDALDSQAKELILNARSQVRSKLLPGQKPPDPPAQLAALQNARRAALVKHRGNLSQALGPTSFARLEQALIAKFKVGPQATAPNPGPGR